MLSNLIKRNKKKGFTLVELIIVIAILAILALILIPQIGTYRQKAEKSNIQASAKTLKNAIDAYNADASSQITTTSQAYSTLVSASGSASGTLDSNNFPSCLDGTTTGAITTLDQLNQVVDGKFTVTKVDGKNSIITVP